MKSSRINMLLYSSHALSAWGDRMWAFAVGLFLVDLFPGSLRLTASYGFSSGGSILLLGALIGNWVDKNHRLSVARNSIIFQNLSVCFSAATICIVVSFQTEVRAIWGGWLETILLVVVIVFAVLADIGSIARQICIERDWIVVMCPGEKELTAMSAFLRRIDLVTNILAPVVTGQIITYGSTVIGAIFIAVWNVVSLFVEYGILYCIYNGTPALHHKDFGDEDKEDSPLTKGQSRQTYGSTDIDPGSQNEQILKKQVSFQEVEQVIQSQSGTYGVRTEAFLRRVSSKHDTEKMKSLAMRDLEGAQISEKNTSAWCVPFYTIIRGWKAYINSEVLLPGLALGSLYMTVLGFDNVTTGFCKEQGLTESIIGVLMAAGALVGIIGTLLFPVLRNKIGLAKTGILALCVEIACLTLCALSVFAPGSPFQPGYLIYNDMNDDLDHSNTSTMYSTDMFDNTSVTSSPGVIPISMVSVIMLMAGIVSSRSGLWMADLTVTQLLLEKPRDNERGIINGVQNSINKLADILKFLLVILFPLPQTFGYLVYVSLAFIMLGLFMFSVYANKHWGTDVQTMKSASFGTSPDGWHVEPPVGCHGNPPGDSPGEPPLIIIGDSSFSSNDMSQQDIVEA